MDDVDENDIIECALRDRVVHGGSLVETVPDMMAIKKKIKVLRAPKLRSAGPEFLDFTKVKKPAKELARSITKTVSTALNR